MTKKLLSRNDTTPAARVATKSCVEKRFANPSAVPKRRSGAIATIAIHAPAIESAYWPILNVAFHHGLRARRSESTEAVHCAMTASAGPANSNVANMNAVEVVTSSASSRRGTRIG